VGERGLDHVGSNNSANAIPFPSKIQTSRSPFDQLTASQDRRPHPARVEEKPDFNGLTAELIVKQFREGTMPESLLRYLLALVWP
jgi:hypothetical protein